MSTKHTPGPWSYFHDTCAVCEANGDAEYIIDGPPGGNHGQFSEEADARLIAAAPDLLEALIETLVIAERNEMGPWRKRAQAAIAKATGAS